MPLSPGSMLERYEIVRLVGRGGMGEVYQATDTRLRRPVALKVLREDKDQSAETGTGGVQRLLREARSAAALNHPNSVAIYELGEADGVAYIAMELVLGESFRRHSKNPNVSVETKLGWLIDAARAFWAAHKSGIIHRDIKPSNIMVSEEGVVKVLDFGLAKPEPSTANMNDPGFQTVLGQVLGTPKYMAPEQLEGKPPDARSDQFAFGLTAYELLTGEYAGGPLGGSAPPMRTLNPLIPPALEHVISRTLLRNVNERFASMEEVAHALRACVPAVHAQRSKVDRDITAKNLNVKDVLVAAASGSAPPALDQPVVTMRIPTPNDPNHQPAAIAVAAAAAPGKPNLGMTMPLAKPLSVSANVTVGLGSQNNLGIGIPSPPGPALAVAPASSNAANNPPSIVSGVFPLGSTPPSGHNPAPPSALAAAISVSAPTPSTLSTPSTPISMPSKRVPVSDQIAPISSKKGGASRTPWVVLTFVIGLIALALGGALALTIRR